MSQICTWYLERRHSKTKLALPPGIFAVLHILRVPCYHIPQTPHTFNFFLSVFKFSHWNTLRTNVLPNGCQMCPGGGQRRYMSISSLPLCRFSHQHKSVSVCLAVSHSLSQCTIHQTAGSMCSPVAWTSTNSGIGQIVL